VKYRCALKLSSTCPLFYVAQSPLSLQVLFLRPTVILLNLHELGSLPPDWREPFRSSGPAFSEGFRPAPPFPFTDYKGTVILRILSFLTGVSSPLSLFLNLRPPPEYQFNEPNLGPRLLYIFHCEIRTFLVIRSPNCPPLPQPFLSRSSKELLRLSMLRTFKPPALYRGFPFFSGQSGVSAGGRFLRFLFIIHGYAPRP